MLFLASHARAAESRYVIGLCRSISTFRGIQVLRDSPMNLPNACGRYYWQCCQVHEPKIQKITVGIINDLHTKYVVTTLAIINVCDC